MPRCRKPAQGSGITERAGQWRPGEVCCLLYPYSYINLNVRTASSRTFIVQSTFHSTSTERSALDIVLHVDGVAKQCFNFKVLTALGCRVTVTAVPISRYRKEGK